MTVAVQTLLDNVETAINAILTGGAVKSYSVNGRQLERMELSDLMSLRDKLKAEIASSTSGGTTNYADFEDPS